ncbi:site-specific DNA-methyltransferase [Gigaspora margarita]|uniref:Site-specific DNA-methyltransferase n=3 Tax=cellular organisms TaxID=131567 RepID=A0A8H3ZYA9_GIGMA|nr:site-specific DNA-methyltransferase [Gigaspora margarita]
MKEFFEIEPAFNPDARVIVCEGDTLTQLRVLPDNAFRLVVSSPPYNLGKAYEKQVRLQTYLDWQTDIIREMQRVTAENGSIIWQVGNFIDKSEVFPLDIYFYPIFKSFGMQLRNRIVWHFNHGLHASNRFSGRYEVLLWFTKTQQYVFNLDPVRVPSKYPGKLHYKGKKAGQPSGNPLGKNPSDYWTLLCHEWDTGLMDIPNVKANHPEKTVHPCQFPVELIERCLLALTHEQDWVLDPFGGRFSEWHAENPPLWEVGSSTYRKRKSRADTTGMAEKRQSAGKSYMKIVAQYDFNGGKSIVEQKYAFELRQIETVVQSIDSACYMTKRSTEKTMMGKMLFAPIEINKAFRREFNKIGWSNYRVVCEYRYGEFLEGYLPSKNISSKPFRDMDFIKPDIKLGVEVQFGKYAFMVYNVCAKMTIFSNMGIIDTGVEIVPVKHFVDRMSTGVSYFEQFAWDLAHRGISNIDIPVLILGIDA